MRNYLLLLSIVLSIGTSQAGVYEEILDAAERADTRKVVDLLQRGMDINTADPAGNTLLMIAARNNNIELVRFLSANRAGVNRRNRFGDTAILLAAIRGHLEASKLLMESGALIDPGGWNVLHYASFAESDEVLRWALGLGLDLNRKAPNGMTALMLAARQGKLEMVKALADAGADRSIVDGDGLDAAGLAQKAGFTETADFLTGPAKNVKN